MDSDNSGFFDGFKKHTSTTSIGPPRLIVETQPNIPRVISSNASTAQAGKETQPSLTAAPTPISSTPLNNSTPLPDEKLAKVAQLQDAVDWFEIGINKPLVKAVCELGWISPTPVQVKVIPAVLQGYDVCARAVTGSGKTAAFLLPLVHKLMANRENDRTRSAVGVRALILTPTRELALQCVESFEALTRFARNQVLCSSVVGGVPIAGQVAELRRAPDAVVATPGRLIDILHNSPGISLETVHTLILDEADKMLSCGYEAFVNELLRHIPKTRQSILVSATMTRDVDKLAKLALTRPLDVDVGHVAVSTQLSQEFIRVKDEDKQKKMAMIHVLCTKLFPSKTLVFAKYLSTVRRIKVILQLLGVKVVALHGELNMEERVTAVEQLSNGTVDVMVATELAARGLDIPNVETVVNYDMATTLTNYIHRVGRTARIGRSGRAVSLVLPVDEEMMQKVVQLTECPFGGVVTKVLQRTLDENDVLHSQKCVDAVFDDAREELLGEQMSKSISTTLHHVQKEQILSAPENGSGKAAADAHHATPSWFETRTTKRARERASSAAFKRAREDGTLDFTATEAVQADAPPELERFTAADLFTKPNKSRRKTASERWLEKKEEKITTNRKGKFWEDTTGVLGGRKVPKRVTSPLELKGHLPKGSFRRVRKTVERQARKTNKKSGGGASSVTAGGAAARGKVRAKGKKTSVKKSSGSQKGKKKQGSSTRHKSRR